MHSWCTLGHALLYLSRPLAYVPTGPRLRANSLLAFQVDEVSAVARPEVIIQAFLNGLRRPLSSSRFSHLDGLRFLCHYQQVVRAQPPWLTRDLVTRAHGMFQAD